MTRQEARTDFWVGKLLEDEGIPYTPQGTDNDEIAQALKTASKRGTGNAGFPEFVSVIKDYVLVIEDKADTSKHALLTKDDVLDDSTKAVSDYAVNGAMFYGKHIAQNTNFKKVFAVGVSGDDKHHEITPLYCDDREAYVQLENIDTFANFSEQNIDEYYSHYVLKEPTDTEKTTAEILNDAAVLHDHLRTYGSLKDQDKPLVVSGILLALDDAAFSVDSLKGDRTNTDGELIYDAIQRRLKASNVGPDAKRDKLMSEFAIIKTSARLNEVHERLNKTPLKFFTEFLQERVFKAIKYTSTSEDFIGRFYGEFMSYSGGDGQTLGIILTPKHICDLFCDLLDVGPDDVCLDPCCGTAGFLVAAMHHMLKAAGNDKQLQKDIKKKQLHGFELQSNMFAIAATNMILRQDGNSNIKCEDFLRQNASLVQQKGATVGMMNPPYSQGSTSDPSQYELSFVEHLLDSLVVGARAAVIVPVSSMTGKTRAEKDFKKNILKNHTLEGVITCNTDTFYGVGTNPVIAVFTAHEPHDAEKMCKFIDFRDDGFEVRPHIGLVEGDSAKDKRAHLLDVWNGRSKAPSKFCVESTVKPEDEWLHSFYYFNDEIPTDADFEKAIGDYLTFQFSMVMQNREYLFSKDWQGCRECLAELEHMDVPVLSEKEWKGFAIRDFFKTVKRGAKTYMPTGALVSQNQLSKGNMPRIRVTSMNNGVGEFTADNSISNFRTFSNFVSVSFLGSAFYQKHESSLDMKVHCLQLKEREMNQYIGHFIAVMMKNNVKGVTYGNQLSSEDLVSKRILLPTTNEGEPDWDYMEQYAKNLMLKKYQQYLEFLEGQVSLTITQRKENQNEQST